MNAPTAIHISSVANQLARDPSPLAVESAVKADLRQIAGLIYKSPATAWRKSYEDLGYEYLCRKVALALLYDGLNMTEFEARSVIASKRDAHDVAAALVALFDAMEALNKEPDEIEAAREAFMLASDHLVRVAEHHEASA